MSSRNAMSKIWPVIVDTRPAAQTCAMDLVLTDSRAQHARRALQDFYLIFTFTVAATSPQFDLQPVPAEWSGITRCSAFRRTDPAFELRLRQHRPPLPGNAILQGRDKGPERAPEIQSTDCRDKRPAGIPTSSGLFATSREISVCTRLRGGAGRTRTSNQTIISRVL